MNHFKVTNFWKTIPHSAFRFKAEFFTNQKSHLDEIYSYTVKSISLPKIDVSIDNSMMFLGDGAYSVPIYNPASRKMSITFEETDDMFITQFFDRLLESFHNVSFRFTIKISEFDIKMKHPVIKGYVCRLINYEECLFEHNGGSTPISLKAEFTVDKVIEKWSQQEVVVGYVDERLHKEENEFNQELTDILEQKEFKFSSKDKISKVQFKTKESEYSKEYKFYNKLNDFDLSKSENAKHLSSLESAYNKAQKLNKRRARDSFENWVARFEKQYHEGIDADMLLSNINKNLDLLLEYNENAKKDGRSIGLAGSSDLFGAVMGDHSVNSKHNIGEKIDVQYYDDSHGVIYPIKVSETNGIKVQVAQKHLMDFIYKEKGVKTRILNERYGTEGFGWGDVTFNTETQGALTNTYLDAKTGKYVSFTTYPDEVAKLLK